MADPNGQEAGIAFLEANKSLDGVVTLPSGLQYKVLSEGGGLEHPTVSTPCDCHYSGRLLDGTQFDSSYDRGEPSAFAPNQVIKGWTEAMQLMVQGDKWELYIPMEMAYGASGKPPKIPAAATLVFIMEIVKIKGATVAKQVTFPTWTTEELALWLEKDQAACKTWSDSKSTAWEGGDEKLKDKYPTRPDLDVWLVSRCIYVRMHARAVTPYTEDTHTHTHTNTHNLSRTNTSRNTHNHTNMHAHTHACTHAQTHAQTRTCTLSRTPPPTQDETCTNSRNKALWKRTRAAKKPSAAAAPAAPPALTKATARELLTSVLDTVKVPANKAKLEEVLKECEGGDAAQAGMMKMVKLMPAVQKMLAPALVAAGYKESDLMMVAMQIQAYVLRVCVLCLCLVSMSMSVSVSVSVSISVRVHFHL